MLCVPQEGMCPCYRSCLTGVRNGLVSGQSNGLFLVCL